MEKKKSLKEWQKEYPNAMRIQATANCLFTDSQLIALAFGKEGKGKVLQDSSHAIWTMKNGTTAHINAIVTPIE